MLFNSFQFLVFFPIVATIYFLLPQRFRWMWLLAASCYFYMAFIPVYIVVLFTTILIDYFAAIWIERSDGRKKKAALIFSVVSTCLVLFIFKYFNFFNDNFAHLARFVGWNYPVGHLSIILPIGLSFHTFQSLSYVIEVYWGRQKPERNFGIYALYVMFFPQLVAGPIERPQNLLHQFYRKHEFECSRVISGLKLMLWGFFKKVVIADRLAVFVNEVYGHPHDFQGRVLLWMTYCFAIQIYCDFSGYADIARGSARVMGFELMKNFKSPYLSLSIGEFWQRWHISLSTWFRDYIYIPMGGNRVAPGRWYYNVIVVFLISGLWHGANWTFIVWGGLHGTYMIVSHLTRNWRQKIAGVLFAGSLSPWRRLWQMSVTFHLVCFAWIFFRANSLADAFAVIKGIFASSVGYVEGFGWQEKLFVFSCIVVMELVQRHRDVLLHSLVRTPLPVRWSVYYGFILFLVFFGTYKSQQFIYFQF